jgi:hypothetical protein
VSVEEIEQDHPNLAASGYEIKSRATRAYNCVAYAAGDEECWWEPIPYEQEGFCWPEDVPRTYEMASFVAVYERLGYELCESHDWETGYEKIAIYADENGEFSHVARSGEQGRWCSKLGKLEDIEHASLAGLEDPAYGRVVHVLRRLLPIPCEVTQ